MKVLNSLISAFSMYSAIPMPKIEWTEENRRYALCFFSFVGAVIGIILFLWRFICDILSVGNFLFGAVSAVIPILVTGGIHLDGFCDVCDAKAACADREKTFEIMRDPRIGAFGAIKLCCLMLLNFGAFSEINDMKLLAVVCCSFVQSRALSGMAAVTFKNAKKTGTLQSFSKPAHRNFTIAFLSVILAVILGVMLFLDPIIGGAGFTGGMLAFLYYRIFSYKKFGGITGDLAGYFLQLCELSVTLFSVIAFKILT